MQCKRRFGQDDWMGSTDPVSSLCHLIRCKRRSGIRDQHYGKDHDSDCAADDSHLSPFYFVFCKVTHKK